MPKLIVPDDTAAVIRTLHPVLMKKTRSSLQRILADAEALTQSFFLHTCFPL
jgi:hypothetical protein